MKKNDGNPLDNTKLALLKLVRLGIGKDFDSQFPDSVDWHQLITLSARQGVITFASHGLQSYYEEHPQLDSAIQAIFAPLYSREMDIERLQFFAMPNYQRKLHRLFGETIARLAQFYAEHDIPMMLLKGHGLSLNYPDPGLRPNGDIDVYLFGKWQEADQAIRQEFGSEIENGIGHHTSLHFADEGISLRHVLDWGFFVEKLGALVDWEWLLERARHYNMHRFLSCIDRICMEHFGFSPVIFPVLEIDQKLTDRVLEEIFLYDGLTLEETLSKKVKRLSLPNWKYNICFSDSRLSYLLNIFWGHLNTIVR